jgi:hypothetical protein
MGKATFRLVSDAVRQRAVQAILSAPEGHIVTIAEPTRNLSQNALLWAMLSDVSKAEPLGRKMTAEEWKVAFMAACGWEVQFLEGLDGRPFPAGFRSSKMTVKQMADLITFITAWGAENGIQWSDRGLYGHR